MLSELPNQFFTSGLFSVEEDQHCATINYCPDVFGKHLMDGLAKLITA